jgi:membrane protease subunit HflC
MSRILIVVVVLIVASYAVLSSLFVVNERQQAIVTRFGEIARVEQEPGLYWKVPTDFVESVQIIEDRILRYDLEDITVQVADGKFYVVDAFLAYKISDPRLFREQVQADLARAEDRIGTRLNSALRQVYGQRDFNAALSELRGEMMREAAALIRSDINDLGIDVVDVRVQRTDLTQEVSQQTFDRMTAERLAEAARLRARGQEQAQTIRAQADRQVVEILASANRDGQILRGEGDATRNAIFAEAYGLDQEFFAFYRSMQSYTRALQDSNTSLVLSPDSEFFQYFQADSSGELPEPSEIEVPESIAPALTAPVEDAEAATEAGQ